MNTKPEFHHRCDADRVMPIELTVLRYKLNDYCLLIKKPGLPPAKFSRLRLCGQDLIGDYEDEQGQGVLDVFKFTPKIGAMIAVMAPFTVMRWEDK